MLAPVSALLRANAPVFREKVLTELYATHPETRLWFPAHSEDAHRHLVFALTYLLDHEPAPDLVDNLAREHRSFGLTPALTRSAFEIIRRALHEVCSDLPYEHVHACDLRLNWIRDTMCDSLEAAPEPAWGRVVDCTRRSRRRTVVRLECPVTPHYLPGQYLAVSSPLIQGYWPHLAPAMPWNPDGFIEFHLSDAPELQGLTVSRPGDQWFFGPAHGNLHPTDTNDLLLISEGTGYAPLRAIIVDMLARGTGRRTHLFFGADYPGELYDLAGLWHLAATSPWLSATPVVRHDTDEWWVGATEHSQAPRGLHLTQTGAMADIVTSYGSWGDRDILISGSPAFTTEVRSRMIDSGSPEGNIQVLAL